MGFQNIRRLEKRGKVIDFLEEEEFFYQAKRKRKKTHKKSDHKHEYENCLIKDEKWHCLVGVCKHCGRIGKINRKDLEKFSDVSLSFQGVFLFFSEVNEDFLAFCKEKYLVIETSLKEVFEKNNMRG